MSKRINFSQKLRSTVWSLRLTTNKFEIYINQGIREHGRNSRPSTWPCRGGAYPIHRSMKQVSCKKEVGVRVNNLLFRSTLWWNVEVCQYVLDNWCIWKYVVKVLNNYLMELAIFVKTHGQFELNRCYHHVFCFLNKLMHWGYMGTWYINVEILIQQSVVKSCATVEVGNG